MLFRARSYCSKACKDAAIKEINAASSLRCKLAARDKCQVCGKLVGHGVAKCRTCLNESKKFKPTLGKSWLKCDSDARFYGKSESDQGVG